MEHLIFSNDSYEMDWLRQDFRYGKVTGPEELEFAAETEQKGDIAYTCVSITNPSDKPYFTNNESIAITFPLPDSYEDSRTCLKKRCHVHIFCGKQVSWICALRMGGEAPHLGMVLTEGSLAAYSIQRNILHQSNDRGCFLLHPEGMQLQPHETRKLRWTIFPHDGKADFLKKLSVYQPRMVCVEAQRYVLFLGETNRIEITPAFPAERVTVNGEEAQREGTSFVYSYTAEKIGELTFSICADDVQTECRILVQERPELLAQRRCRFLAKNQQYTGEGPLNGAYLAYDNEEERLVYTPENDFNGGRERIGMGILMARYLQQKKDENLMDSLEKYRDFVLRELVDKETGCVYNDMERDDSYHRLYNAPWAATLFTELYRLEQKREYLTYACRIVKRYYQEGGKEFYPIELPVLALIKALGEVQMEAEQREMRVLFINHADWLCGRGLDYPPSEVNYEQSIVAPAAQILLSVYLLTGKEKYLHAGGQQVKVLELFNGMQPDYHLYESAVRHWDGYWFGKRRYYGDTFPHYWSALTGNVFALYAKATKDASYMKRAEDSRRGVLPMIFPDGRASCAYVYPQSVNNRRASFYDPYANDQDWGLYFYLREGEAYQRD